ncbi:hypothetical protein X975_05208, partial [Stegodyphus mimosarum]
MQQRVIKIFKAYYMRQSFADMNKSRRQNNQLFVKNFWTQFSVLSVIRIDEKSWKEISPNTLNSN